jgi:peptide methionine sulfoxide reductase MsrB
MHRSSISTLLSSHNSTMANTTSTTTRTKNVLRLCLLLSLSSEQVVIVNSFLTSTRRSISRTTTTTTSTTTASNYHVTKFYSTPLSLDPQEFCGGRKSTAVLLLGSHYVSLEEEQIFLNALESAGYSNFVSEQQKINHNDDDDDDDIYYYEFSKATGMLKLISTSPQAQEGQYNAPRWVPVVRGEENVLVANGWSFLDPDDESDEPMMSFDGETNVYSPKWGISPEGTNSTSDNNNNSNNNILYATNISPLGYDISSLTKDHILTEAEYLSQENDYSRGVLLDGKTDPPNTKTTCNGYDFRGSTGQADIPSGIFLTAIGGLPLFASTDLAPTTSSSGWLSFSRPLTISHVIHIDPEQKSTDRRIEVICARSKCHLGHYFGPSEGYCINTSALRFIGQDDLLIPTYVLPASSLPISWDHLARSHGELIPSHRILKTILERYGR